ncbi:uncharacterized protein LOC131590721 [Poecile atricapillus]|uniref:uncharacterized protein LOC131590721 n=1 Tax=Poecile atricapillus TaxID=48891 RepID=UPI00273987FB|nr:uncharacterized protein LOC131590721 [Poecile atricapillus]
MSQWEEDEDEELSHWEEDDDEEMPRMALLGGMERGPSSSRELPGMEEMSCHQKVLEWLDANFPNDYGVEEEEEEEYEYDGYEFLSSQVWNQWKEQAEARLEEVLYSMSFLGVTVGDLVLSKRKRCRDQKMSRGEDGSQAKQRRLLQWAKELFLVELPCEAPAHRRGLGDIRCGPSCRLALESSARSGKVGEKTDYPEPHLICLLSLSALGGGSG